MSAIPGPLRACWALLLAWSSLLVPLHVQRMPDGCPVTCAMHAPGAARCCSAPPAEMAPGCDCELTENLPAIAADPAKATPVEFALAMPSEVSTVTASVAAAPVPEPAPVTLPRTVRRESAPRGPPCV